MNEYIVKLKDNVSMADLAQASYDLELVWNGKITRCKDCKKSKEPCNGWDRRCELIGVVDDNFFCGWGEPKDKKE